MGRVEYVIAQRSMDYATGYWNLRWLLYGDVKRRAWASVHAETIFPPSNSKIWCAAVELGDHRSFSRALATRAIEPPDEPGFDAKMTDNVEFPESWDADHYGVVFDLAEAVTDILGLRRVYSYIFPDPWDIHEASGYRKDGPSGISALGHEWFRVVRER